MPKKLGVYVTSNARLPQLVKLCQAARRNGIEVDLFFTHLGCGMMDHELFQELAEVTSRMALCKVCFQEHGGEGPVPGFTDEDFVTQMRHCEIIEGSDRYLNF